MSKMYISYRVWMCWIVVRIHIKFWLTFTRHWHQMDALLWHWFCRTVITLNQVNGPFAVLVDIQIKIPLFYETILAASHLPIKPLLPHWPTSSSISFEYEATTFFEQLELMGFNIESWTKAPYLCEGDIRQSFYWLIDVVVVLSKKPMSTCECSHVYYWH